MTLYGNSSFKQYCYDFLISFNYIINVVGILRSTLVYIYYAV